MATKIVDFHSITIDELRDLLRDKIEVVLMDGATPIGRVLPMPDVTPAGLSIDDLLALPTEQRQQAIAEALARAAHEDFELFEASEFLEINDSLL